MVQGGILQTMIKKDIRIQFTCILIAIERIKYSPVEKALILDEIFNTELNFTAEDLFKCPLKFNFCCIFNFIKFKYGISNIIK